MLFWAAMVVILGMIAAGLGMVVPAVAAEPDIVQVGYTVGKEGHELKWLPVLGSPSESSSQVRQVGGVLEDDAVNSLPGPITSAPPQRSSAFRNPFGDKKTPARVAQQPRLQATQGEPRLAPPKASLAAPKAPALLDEEPAPRVDAPRQGGVPSVEVPLAMRGDDCPRLEDLRPIREKKIIDAVTPTKGEFPKMCPMDPNFKPRSFAPLCFTWKASGLCHKPLYFEDVQLERYGHSLGPWVQPFASAAHFFLTVPALPYLMGLKTPDECVYTLGYYRPGSCAPYMLDPLPISIRAALFEGAAIAGGVLIIP